MTVFTALPVALYGVVLLMCAIVYSILSRSSIAHHGDDSALAHAIGRDRKGVVSLVLYLLAIPLAFVRPSIACAIYVGVALLWLVPDRRIEHALHTRGEPHG